MNDALNDDETAARLGQFAEYQAQRRLPCTVDAPLALALSGGGHRAALYALGGLMAIVDTGANRRTRQIGSVSGGSITNLVVACACDFRRTMSQQFDAIAQELFETLTHGVLTKPALWLLGATVFGPPILSSARSRLPSVTL